MYKRYLALYLLLAALPLWASSPKVDTVSASVDQERSLHLSIQIPEGYHQLEDPDFFYLELLSLSARGEKTSVEQVKLGKTRYPRASDSELGPAHYGTVDLEAALEGTEGLPKGSYQAEIRLHYQLCDEENRCYLPDSLNYTVSFRLSGEASSASAVSVLIMLLSALLGGLLLNIMPCVFPILSIRALNLVRQSNGDRKAITKSGFLYWFGIEVSFIILATVVIVLQASGQAAGWGFQFQNPNFVLVLSVLLFVFALSLFDLYSFQAPLIRRSGAQFGSFVNGLFAVLLATPCTAPFLGSALGFAFSQSPLWILLFFLTVGSGFALPFVLLGLFPSLIQRIPKPGPWMNRFKQLMGFALIASSIYFLSVYETQQGGKAVISILAFLLSITAAFWLYGIIEKNPAVGRQKKWIALLLLIILTVGSGLIFIPDTDKTREGVLQEETVLAGPERIPFRPETLEQFQSQGEAVFLVFSAEWCSVCKLNDKRIFRTERAAELFSKYGVRLLYGDYTRADPVIGRWLNKLGRAGVPLYAYFPPGASEPILLPELLNFEDLENAFLDDERKLKNADFF